VELADLVLVNRADGETRRAAERAASFFRAALALASPRRDGWVVPVGVVSALEGTGVGESWTTILRCHDQMTRGGHLATKRSRQNLAWLSAELTDGLLGALRSSPEIRTRLAEVEPEVALGLRSPIAAAESILDLFLSSRSRP